MASCVLPERTFPLSRAWTTRALYCIAVRSPRCCPPVCASASFADMRSLVGKIVVVKQTNDVHTNLFFQMLCSKFIETYGLDDHIRSINKLYGENCAVMLDAMDKTFPKSVTYTRPEGGLFLWVTLPEGTDMKDFLARTIAAKVAVVRALLSCRSRIRLAIRSA